MKYLMIQSCHHGLLVEGPAIPCYHCLILQVVFSLLPDTLSDNDALQRNFWLHHNDCLMDTSLMNCLILTSSVSFVRADSRNNWYWHCWLSYLMTMALQSVQGSQLSYSCVFIEMHIYFSKIIGNFLVCVINSCVEQHLTLVLYKLGGNHFVGLVCYALLC